MSFFTITKDIGIDLGTSNTSIYIKGKGIVLKEPSVVAINTNNKSIIAVGNEAKQMIGRTPGNIITIKPIKHGVIADFNVAESMLTKFIAKAASKVSFSNHRIIVSFPSGVTDMEKKTIEEITKAIGAKEVRLIEKPMAAAIGAGLPVEKPMGNMVVDIGGGTTEIAIISLGGIVTSNSLRIGGNELEQAIINYIKKEYSLMVGEITVENLKIKLGSVYKVSDSEENIKMKIIGQDFLTGLPKNIQISEEEVMEVLRKPVATIIDSIKYTLEKTPPELASDIINEGIMLTGGGALLKGLNSLIENETSMSVYIAEEPLDCVALGIGRVLEHFV